MSPMQRSKKYLEQQGYRVAITEHWNSFARCRVDLFGVIDLLAMRPGAPLLAIQTTSTSNLSARLKKDPITVRQWLSTGAEFQFHGWSRQGARGKRKTWTLTIKGLNQNGDVEAFP